MTSDDPSRSLSKARKAARYFAPEIIWRNSKNTVRLFLWFGHLLERDLFRNYFCCWTEKFVRKRKRETDIGQSNGIIFCEIEKKTSEREKDFRLLQLIACDLTVRVT